MAPTAKISLIGLLRLADVPFVGCDLAASAVAMDKVLTKQVAEATGLAVVPYVWFTAHDWQSDRAAVIKTAAQVKLPAFIKPVHLGSSIGITRAETLQELENGLEVAFHYDDKVLVEEAVADHIEVTLPIMGTTNHGQRYSNAPRPGSLATKRSICRAAVRRWPVGSIAPTASSQPSWMPS